MTAASYPVRVDATLDAHMSRWRWLFKWLLVIPHVFVLAFLWVAFVFVSVVAFVAIAVTGRYPRGLFDFNVGVLRWTWRVQYYTYGALGTDQYPPFTLAEVPGYPAHLEVAYPQRLSRGLVWVKWWLLAIPHYLVTGIFLGGGSWLAWQAESHGAGWVPGGLIGLLVLIAAVILTVTGQYPRQLFDLVLGMNRWVLRVAAYAGLMTDEYPPFRLDMGGPEPGGTLTVAPTGAPGPTVEPWVSPPPGPAPKATRAWTAGRVAALVTGAVLGLVSLGLLVGGGVATWADNTQRDATGYLTSGAHPFATASHALTSDQIDLGSAADVVTPAGVLGTVRLRVTPTAARTPVFVGIAPQSAATAYLSGVSHDVVTSWSSGSPVYRSVTGGALARPPGAAGIWTAQSAGVGTQTLTWKPAHGQWAVVVMNADGSAGVSVVADAGATVPALGDIGIGLLVAGGVLLLVATALVAVPVTRASSAQPVGRNEATTS